MNFFLRNVFIKIWWIGRDTQDYEYKANRIYMRCVLLTYRGIGYIIYLSIMWCL